MKEKGTRVEVALTGFSNQSYWDDVATESNKLYQLHLKNYHSLEKISCDACDNCLVFQHASTLNMAGSVSEKNNTLGEISSWESSAHLADQCSVRGVKTPYKRLAKLAKTSKWNPLS